MPVINPILKFLDTLQTSQGVVIPYSLDAATSTFNFTPTIADPQEQAKAISGIGQVNQYNLYSMPTLKMQAGSRKTGETLLAQVASPAINLKQ